MLKAEVRIDLRRRLGAIDRNIYGGFIEHLGRCVYGGIFEPGSPLADGQGFRHDVLEAMRRLRPPNLRWPGGNFVSGYHWLDGVGPPEERPRRWDLAWRKEESNLFGTSEFIACCRALGTEPYLCANLGSGTLDEAAGWVEYCNATSDTHYANLRRRHGSLEPYGVRYWGLGNEVFGFWQVGHKTAVQYAEQAREYGKAMKWVDPSIRLVACGAGEPEWDWEVLKTVAPLIDYISVHAYFRPDAQEPYYSLLTRPREQERYIHTLWELICAARRQHRTDRPIRIAFDEWNVWYRATAPGPNPLLEETYDLTDALCVASFLNMLQRNCVAIGMANIAQMVNVLAPIITSPQGLFLQTIYFPLLLQAEHSGPIALDVWAESDDVEIPGWLPQRLPLLDVSATLDEEKRVLYVSAVNLSRDDEMTVELRFLDVKVAPEGVRYLCTGREPSVTNSFAEPENVGVKREELKKLAPRCRVTLPRHSASVLELSIGWASA
jgi:alpha-N-arabinofuranosidase